MTAKWQLTKKEAILKVLHDNPGTWMSAGEIARTCRGGKWCSSKDIASILREDYEGVERADVSRNSSPEMRYCYTGGGAE